jgi:hypothetical protein
LTVTAKGRLEPAVAGMKVQVTLLRRTNGVFKRVARKTVSVKSLTDRDGDGLNEGLYSASFKRGRHAKYKFVARYLGSATYRTCTRTVIKSL